VTWQNWKLRVSLDPREGLVLHTISFTDGERERPIIYRASVAEMVVPYGDPSPTRFWISSDRSTGWASPSATSSSRNRRPTS
jgi:primary-amine oxidase